MEILDLEKTRDTPRVHMDPATGRIEFEGECYPENAFDFFSPILDWVRGMASAQPNAAVAVSFKLNYFNSSASKCLLDFFELLESHHQAGGKVTVHWFFEENDEDIQESGEDFAEDLSFDFHIKAISAND